ncbi:DUF2057 domain-containing protein [Psychromonas ossibalaenae]|uniref:DUF2057 domain-containing protein n=1 Tax=Psychromonas ossibalaenae TaxID=444922 RepID=UPI00037B0128|nr:DUF2057 domain-containing protein [Psychromonas ossibalaenae]
MKGLVLLLSLIMVPFSQANSLIGGKGVEILAVDGQKIKSNFFTSADAQLTEGSHQVVVKYVNSFRNKELIHSKPYIFDIEVIGETEIAVKNFNTQSQAENEMRKGLTWIVSNEQETKKIAGSDTLHGEGYLPYSDIEKLITAYNNEQGITLANAPATAAVTTTPATAGEPNNNLNQAKSEQLMQLYNSASKEERKAFRIWLLEQEMK